MCLVVPAILVVRRGMLFVRLTDRLLLLLLRRLLSLRFLLTQKMNVVGHRTIFVADQIGLVVLLRLCILVQRLYQVKVCCLFLLI